MTIKKRLNNGTVGGLLPDKAIVEQTNMTSADVAADLLILELTGLVEKLPGAKYQKI